MLMCSSRAIGAQSRDERIIPFIGRAANVQQSRKTYTYKTVDDCAIQADVYRLPGGDIRPVILWLHGGALIFSDRTSVTQHQLQRYLRAGYVVVSVDYRLAPETKLAAILEDLRDAYQWLRKDGPQLFRIDPDRVALIGNSAGAYLALLGGFTLKPRPKALVSFYGYGDITGEWTVRPQPDYLKLDKIAKEEAFGAVGEKVISGSPIFPRVVFYNYCRQNGLWPTEVVGVDPTSAGAKLKPFCPIQNVTSDYPPTLLLHGDKDADVPFDQSVQMAAMLKRKGVFHQLITMHNYDHLFDAFPSGFPPQGPPTELKDPRVIEAFDSVLAFLKAQMDR